ncbi:hypothetical protein FZEAL_8767 [Fusarium zealandicum]|uniref:Zn(2)-C6 fungal-type domain-containing protein n=1 Tax=Fusarium zealandicum TaxID=1053134 RepID=A0A8H4UDM8_9HYPO|nr:hypothetical protein FZEAL_8767 [Fusarium zealandicum]
MMRLDSPGGSEPAHQSDQPARPPPSQRLPVNPRRNKVKPEHRKRVSTACNSCNVRRVKCSGEQPCRQCRSSSRDCVYPAPIEKVSIIRSELEELRRKVDTYEKVLRDTVPETVNAVSDATRRHELLPGLLGQTGFEHATGVVAAGEETRKPLAVAPSGAVTMTAAVAAPHHHPELQRQYQPLSQPQVLFQDSRFKDPKQDHPRLQNLHSPPPVAVAHPRQHDEDQASTEGRLLHDPDGHARFLGETSGATFLDYLKEFMTTVLPLAYQNLRPGSDGSAFLSSLGRYQTYDSRPLHERDVDPFWLPLRQDMAAMLSELRFFIQDGNGNWPSGGIYWWGDLTSIPNVPPIEQDSHIVRLDKCRHLAFYHTAFAVVSQATTTPPQDTTVVSHLSEFFSRARLLLGNPLDITQFTMNEVAALTLMGFYLIEMNRRDAAYMCVSNAMHISIMHGAHRGWVDESGKRVFWTLYVLDRYLSCLMGRPPTIMDDAIRLPLPCEAPSMPPASGLNAHVELARISGHIVCNTYRVSPWETKIEPLLTNALLQLIILTIRPVFFAAVKKTFAEKLVTRQSSLSSHPQLVQLRRCVGAAEHNIRLARQILLLNRPRKLLQAGLHFIFNAAICLMLQELVYGDDSPPRDEKARGHDLDFVIARFEDESRIGSNYGRDCATVLRDLRVLIQRLRSPVDVNPDSFCLGNAPQVSTTYDPIQNRTTVDIGQQWPEKVTLHGLQQPILVEQGHILYDELVSWIDGDWQSYSGYLI